MSVNVIWICNRCNVSISGIPETPNHSSSIPNGWKRVTDPRSRPQERGENIDLCPICLEIIVDVIVQAEDIMYETISRAFRVEGDAKERNKERSRCS